MLREKCCCYVCYFYLHVAREAKYSAACKALLQNGCNIFIDSSFLFSHLNFGS